MKKFYEVNTHEVCEGIISSINAGQSPVINNEELMALAVKMLWLEQDYAYVRGMGIVKVRLQENYKKNYKMQSVNNEIDRILEMARIK